MSDQQAFGVWCVVRQLPNLQNAIVVRHSQRSLAEEQMKLLQRFQPEAFYELMFEPNEAAQ